MKRWGEQSWWKRAALFAYVGVASVVAQVGCSFVIDSSKATFEDDSAESPSADTVLEAVPTGDAGSTEPTANFTQDVDASPAGSGEGGAGNVTCDLLGVSAGAGGLPNTVSNPGAAAAVAFPVGGLAPSETCIVEPGQGQISGEDVDDVLVSCNSASRGLVGMRFNVGNLDPSFDIERSRYRVDVPFWTMRVSVEPIVEGPMESVTVDGVAYDGQPRFTNLAVGRSDVVIEGPVETGERRSFVVEIYRAGFIRNELYGKAPMPAEYDRFGHSLAFDGSTIVVGMPQFYHLPDATADELAAQPGGAVRIIERTENGWTHSALLEAPHPGPQDRFGMAVALSGDLLVVGAEQEDGAVGGIDPVHDNDTLDAGAAYVFEREGAGWAHVATLKHEWPEAEDEFGNAVAIDGERIVVGAHYESSDRSGVNPESRNTALTRSGAAFIFERREGEFVQVAYLKASNPDEVDGFGASVAIQGNTVMVGAPTESSASDDPEDDNALFAGAVYVFELEAAGGSWVQAHYLKAPIPKTRAFFGNALSLDGNRLAIGAFTDPSSFSGVDPAGDDSAAAEAGAVHVFTLSRGTWEQEAFIKASNADAGDRFGDSVILRGDSLVVGAPLESSALGGINGPQNDNTYAGAGAVYLFDRSAGAWSQFAYLKAGIAEPGDNFGDSLGFDGLRLVVAATGEDNANGGLEQEPSPNNVMGGSGAIYLFR